MKKICNTCKYWLRYKKYNNNCYCEMQANAFREVYTHSQNTCLCWAQRDIRNYKKFRNSIKPKLKIE